MKLNLKNEEYLRKDSYLYDSKFDLFSFKKLVGKRSIAIYSANLEGIGLAGRLQALGFKIKGFVDSRYYKNNAKKKIPILKPEWYWQNSSPENDLIIIATKHRNFKKKVLLDANNFGFKKDIDVIYPLDLCNFFPTIEIAGKCNLFCKTCDMGLPNANKGKGHMSLTLFKLIIEKLAREIPFINSVALYIWGEPLLNKNLSKMIKICKDFGIATEISTNLNFQKYLEDVIDSEPEQMVLPCAGTGKIYERGRTGGQWEKFLSGCKKIRSMIDSKNKDINVRITYHLYKDNLDDEYDKVQKIAKELNYEFIPILANIFPGKILDYANGINLPNQMSDACKDLVFDIDEQLQYAQSIAHKPCHITKVFPAITWNGEVLHCCNMTNPKVGTNYLQNTLQELMQMRNDSSFCTNCMNKGVHRYHDSNIELVDKAGGRLVKRI